jgi:hypothetical protein
MLKVKRPYVVLTGIILFSIFIDLPFFYLVYLPSTNVLVNYGYPGRQVWTYYAASKTVWSAWGNDGYSIMLFVYIFKNLLTFLAETTLNIISLVLFQRHLAHKASLVGGQRNTTALDATKDGTSVVGTNALRSQAGQRGNSESPGGRNMANLVLVKSSTGFVHNMFLTTYTIYYLNNPKVSLTLRILQFCSYMASTFRHGINLALLYSFNTSFRKEVYLVISKIGFFKTASTVSPTF